MTKQLIVLAFAAAFGIAHAADMKPAGTEVKPTATVKAEAPKAADAVKAPEAKPAAAPEMKKEEAKPAAKPMKAHKAKKSAKKAAPVTTPEAPKAAEPAKK